MSSQGSDHHGHGVHFFKVILQSNLRDEELRVPKSFVRRYWKQISPTVVLRLPNGTEWKVDWLRRDGDVWFCDGWKEFAEYLSLKEAQFLVFRYEGGSKFNVIVLDIGGIEVKYPSSKEDDDHGEGQKGYESDETSLEIIDRKRRPRSPSSSSHARKKVKIISPTEEEPESYNIHDETQVGKKKDSACSESAKDKNNNEVLDARMRDFSEAVNKSFRTDKKFFECLLKKSYIERDLLVIPNEFAKPFLQDKEGNATLFLGDKLAWDVKLRYACRQLRIASGWKKFVVDNNLRVGDVCVFELMDRKKVSFKVHINRFRVEPSSDNLCQDPEGLSHKPSSLRNHEIPKTKSGSMSNWSFTIQLKHGTPLQHYVVIPKDFVKSYNIHNETYVTLRVGERSWPVKILSYPKQGDARFSQGWRSFVKDCNLENGDSVHCELINEENLEFLVTIMRKTRVTC